MASHIVYNSHGDIILHHGTKIRALLGFPVQDALHHQADAAFFKLGKLDDREDIFMLTYDELRAGAFSDLDMKALAKAARAKMEEELRQKLRAEILASMAEEKKPEEPAEAPAEAE